jgi:chromosomal replication initiator protein
LLPDEVEQWRSEHDNSVYSGYTFDRYIVGNNNRFAHAAALAVAKKPASLYNPLFIYGGSGLGKTHLLFAIASYIRRSTPSAKIVYIKSEDFMNELVAAIDTGFAPFREKYRKADLLLVDDVQFLSGKDRMQEEFFNTFETLHQAGKQIVLTCDRPPKEMAGLETRLVTRFESGLLADIKAPDLETRMALVKSKAILYDVDLSQEVIEVIAENITNNVRELEGAVKKISAIHKLMGIPITRDMAMDAIQDLFTSCPGLRPTPQLILDEVARFYGLPAERIKSKGRTKDVVLPRQITYYLIRELVPDKSLPEIGAFMGQHHTTVLYGINSLTDQLAEDESLRAVVNDLKKTIQNL